MNNILNIAIIGGGAAGFFAAITAKKTYPKANITIFERGNKVLAKVEVTGGGRCNLTNTFANITDLKQAYPRGSKLMKRLFKSFDNEACMQWFRSHGVPLIIQEDQCVFPKAQDSHAVINALTKEAKRLGINIIVCKQLIALEQPMEGYFRLTFKDGTDRLFHRVAITTGGAPLQKQLAYLQTLNHKVEAPVPSLFTFNIDDKKILKLMGTVIDPVVATMLGTKLRTVGPLLITHWGMSGPAILKLSSHAARILGENDYKGQVAINWVGERTRTEVETTINRIISENPKKQLGNVRPFNLTTKLWLYLIDKVELEETKPWGELGKKGFNRMVEVLVNDVYGISGKGSYKEEFVTCGGISLKSINQNTLESKTCSGLFFAGEILNVDGITGGFNLQAAWTMGYTVGLWIGKTKEE